MMNNSLQTPVMEVRNLCKHYPSGGRASLTRAVDGVSLVLRPGETFGVVGESGCGKSTLARLMMSLEKPTSGEVFFRGTRIDNMPERQLRALRPRFQMVFQDSGSSLNPRKRVQDILAEPMLYHRVVSRREAAGRTYLPLSVTIHHAAADGFHLARFLNEAETLSAGIAGRLLIK